MKTISIKIEDSLYDRLKEDAWKKRITLSQLIRDVLQPSGKVVEPEKIPEKKEPENIKKSPSIQEPVPYTEDEDIDLDQFLGTAKKKKLVGVLLRGKKYTIEEIANEAKLDSLDIKQAWRDGKTPYYILGGQTMQSTWIEEA